MTENTDPLPLRYRLILVEVFAAAELQGLGRLHVGFTATPGREDEAADFVAEDIERRL